MSIASKSFKITWKLIKLFGTAVVLFVCIFLLWRVFSRGTPKNLETLTVNEDIRTAYTENQNSLNIFTQEHLTLTSDGLFGVPQCLFIPEANQIQIIVRYNNSTLRALADDEKYKLESVPKRTDNVFDVTLLLQTDLTPDNSTDNGGNIPEAVEYTRCHGTLCLSGEKNLYNFRKYVFDLDSCGIDLGELMDSGLLLAIYADFYYVEDVNYDEKPYGTLFLYDYLAENLPYKLTAKDKKAINAFGEN